MPPKRPVGGGAHSTFGRRISRARVALKLKAQDVAERLGVGKNTVYSWEQGKTVPQRGRLAVLADMLDLDVNELEDLINSDQNAKRDTQAVSTVSSSLPVYAEIAGNQFVLEISSIKVNVPMHTVPIYVRVAIGPIESEVTREPRRTP